MGTDSVEKAQKASDNNDDLDFGLYPSIAVSDGVNSACCWYASHQALEKGSPDVAFGIGLVAIASTIGTIRFGFAPKQCAYWNNLLAHAAGTVGVPLIGFGFANSRGLLPLSLGGGSFPLPLVVLLAAGSVLSRMSLSHSASELYTTLLCVGAMGSLLYGENFMENGAAVAAVATFVFAGVVVGADRHKCTLGVRHENWFHYFLGTSMLIFGRALSLRQY